MGRRLAHCRVIRVRNWWTEGNNLFDKRSDNCGRRDRGLDLGGKGDKISCFVPKARTKSIGFNRGEVVRAVVEGSFERRRAERKGRSLLSGKVEFTAVRSIQSNLCYSKGREKERRGRELKIRNIGGQMSILHDRWIDSHDSRPS